MGSWQEFMIHSVDVWRFSPSQDADGGAASNYPDGSPYAAAVPCYVENEASERVYDDQDRVTQVDHYAVFFEANYGFRLNDRIDWTDAGGAAHRLLVSGVSDMIQTLPVGLCEVAAVERS